MKFSDFLKYYPYSFICKYERGFKYSYKRFLQTPDENIVVCKFNLKKAQKVMINLHQKSARTCSEIPNYRNTMSRIILCKYNPNKAKCYEFIKSHASTSEKLHLEFAKLEPGQYYVFSHVNWPYVGYNNDYVISTYAEDLVDIESVAEDEVAEDFLHMIFYDYLEKHEEKRKLNDTLQLEVSCKDNDLGFYMMLFKNTSKNETHTISFDVDMNKNVRICTQHENKIVNKETSDSKNYSLKFSVEPEVDYLVLFEIENEPWNSKLSIGSVKVTSRKGSKPDPLKGELRKHLKSLVKIPLDIKDISVAELETDENVFLLFVNNSENSIKAQIAPYDTINLTLEDEKSNLFIESKDFSYVKMIKQEKGVSFDFKYTYCIKKLLI
jgi:hypothetical protein